MRDEMIIEEIGGARDSRKNGRSFSHCDAKGRRGRPRKYANRCFQEARHQVSEGRIRRLKTGSCFTIARGPSSNVRIGGKFGDRRLPDAIHLRGIQTQIRFRKTDC
jgi:hypothetical protein